MGRFHRVPAATPAAPSPIRSQPAGPVADAISSVQSETDPAANENEQAEEADTEADYKVGRGKPPLHTQWKKGQSGNPAGKKAGTRNSATIALDVFGEVITIQTPTGPRRMNTIALAYYKLREMVAKGDLKAIATVIAIWQRIMPDPLPDTEAAEPALSADDEAILKELLDQLGAAPRIMGRGGYIAGANDALENGGVS